MGLFHKNFTRTASENFAKSDKSLNFSNIQHHGSKEGQEEGKEGGSSPSCREKTRG